MAIEAHRGLAQILSANAFGNHLYNVSVVSAAVGAERGVIDFPNPPLNSGGNFGTLAVASAAAMRPQPTLMLPLDDLAAPDAAFIKVDVEGFESEVLKGARRTLMETRPVWLIEASHMNKPASRATIATMLDAGYRVHWFFSPFVMANHLKMGAENPPVQGDYSILALPPGAPNLWDLPAVDGAEAQWPTNRKDFTFFERYGY